MLVTLPVQAKCHNIFYSYREAINVFFFLKSALKLMLGNLCLVAA